MLKECLFVMLGGGIGAMLRHIVSSLLSKKFTDKHWATFWINITGCFVLGILFNKVIGYNKDLYVFLIVGVIGSYTTFSAFEYENIDLIAHERYVEFLKYTIFSCGFTFLAILGGFYIAKIM